MTELASITTGSFGSSSATVELVEGWIFGPDSVLPGLMLVRLTDSRGFSGLGETFYVPVACWASIEALFAPKLLGRQLSQLGCFPAESLSALRRLVGMGAEYRALSAIDVALWDLAAKWEEVPLRRLLNPESREAVTVYNSCVGPSYTSGARVPGDGNVDVNDPRDDYAAWMSDAGALARELVAAGFTAMKLWPFDRLAKELNGRRANAQQLAEATRPLREIRQAVGDKIDIMIDGHGLWQPCGAIEVAGACAQFNIRWLEDLVLAHPLDGLRTLRANTDLPILASEYLASLEEYSELLAAGVADIIMVDPTWAGGITNGMVLAELAEQHDHKVSYHDCTGPVTLLAGANMASAINNHDIQEVARGLFNYVYPEIVDWDCALGDGQLYLGQEPGIGLDIKGDLSSRPGVTYRRLERS
jgi:galactonate dehydratase